MTKAARGLAGLLLAALTGCGDGDVTPIGTEPADPTGDVAFTPLSATPDRLEFVHFVGLSPCPQVIGVVTLRNASGPGRGANVSVDAPLLLLGRETLVREGSVPVPAGQDVRFEVFFDCEAQGGRRGAVLARVRVFDGTTQAAVVTVTGTVN
jgi:hypothetical protein